MIDILANRTREARNECQDIRDIIEKEEIDCWERIDKQIRPIIVKEFRRVAAKYGLTGIRFGNGTCLIMSNKGDFLIDAFIQVNPKGLDRLRALCDCICFKYPTEDITLETI